MRSAEERTLPLVFRDDRGIAFLKCKCGLQASIGMLRRMGGKCPACDRAHELPADVAEIARPEKHATTAVPLPEIPSFQPHIEWTEFREQSLTMAWNGREYAQAPIPDTGIRDEPSPPKRPQERPSLADEFGDEAAPKAPEKPAQAPGKPSIPPAVLEALPGQPACEACGARLTETCIGLFYPCAHDPRPPKARDRPRMKSRAEVIAEREAKKKAEAAQAAANATAGDESVADALGWADPAKDDPLTGRKAVLPKENRSSPRVAETGRALNDEMRKAKDEENRAKAKEHLAEAEKPLFRNAKAQGGGPATDRRAQFDRLVESAFDVDLEAEAAACKIDDMPAALVGNRAEHHKRVNQAAGLADRAYVVYLVAKETLESIEHETEPRIAAMRDEARHQLEEEKRSKERTKTITEADVAERAANLFADEWFDIQERLTKAKNFVDLWRHRAGIRREMISVEKAMLESCR